MTETAFECQDCVSGKIFYCDSENKWVALIHKSQYHIRKNAFFLKVIKGSIFLWITMVETLILTLFLTAFLTKCIIEGGMKNGNQIL